VQPVPRPHDYNSEFVTIFGLPIWNPAYSEFKRWWDAALQEERCALMGIANAHTLNLAYKDPSYMEALRSFDCVINDGVGLEMAAKMRGMKFHYNFNGTDLFPRLFAEQQGPLRVFLYGAAEASNAGAAERIHRDYKNVEVVGRVNGFVDQATEALPAIQEAKADLLLVALGQPLQERFLARYGRDLEVKVASGVGALFDFMSGNAPRAPEALRRLKMEWAYRLVREPKRLFNRYVIGNPKFIVRAHNWKERDRS
jgi:exopolysaccharide biosynthesis WecB/TagA/CpsF family protein